MRTCSPSSLRVVDSSSALLCLRVRRVAPFGCRQHAGPVAAYLVGCRATACKPSSWTAACVSGCLRSSSRARSSARPPVRALVIGPPGPHVLLEGRHCVDVLLVGRPQLRGLVIALGLLPLGRPLPLRLGRRGRHAARRWAQSKLSTPATRATLPHRRDAEPGPAAAVPANQFGCGQLSRADRRAACRPDNEMTVRLFRRSRRTRHEESDSRDGSRPRVTDRQT